LRGVCTRLGAATGARPISQSPVRNIHGDCAFLAFKVDLIVLGVEPYRATN